MPVRTLQCIDGLRQDGNMAYAKNQIRRLVLLIVIAGASAKIYREEGKVDREDAVDDLERNGHEDRGHGHGHGHAHSYHHFSGPVSGHHAEVTWKDKHGHHHHDYRAHPEYKYSYGVDDHHTKDHHGQKEHRDGKEVHGEYHIHEPGGNVRMVKYHSDPHGGFFAEVHNYGGNDHSGGTYGGHKHR